MSQLSDRLQLLEILENNERATAELYLAYASLFPLHREFWMQLSADETRHTAWVAGLVRQARDGSLAIQEGRFREDIFLAYRDYVRQKQAEARARALTLVAALAVARDLEGTMVERSFFMVMESDSPALAQVLRNLHHSTENHAATIERKWLEVTKAPPGAR